MQARMLSWRDTCQRHFFIFFLFFYLLPSYAILTWDVELAGDGLDGPCVRAALLGVIEPIDEAG
jgi:hypothetical protein